MNKIQEATKEFLKDNIPEFGSGDTLSIDVKVKEGNKNESKNMKVLLSLGMAELV